MTQPQGNKLYQGFRGRTLAGADIWEDLSPAEYEKWCTAGYRTRVAMSAEPLTALPGSEAPISDARRVDWCIRKLHTLKVTEPSLSRYEDIQGIISALQRALTVGLEEGPENGDLEELLPLANYQHAILAKAGWQVVPKEATAEMLDNTSSKGGLAREDWNRMLAVAPTPPPLLSQPLAGPGRLTERKTSEIQTSRGYQRVGYVLVNDRGDVCISAQAAVRWLPKAHYGRLMHEQNSKLFDAPEVIPATPPAPAAEMVKVGELLIAQDESRIPAMSWPGPYLNTGSYPLFAGKAKPNTET